MSEDGSPSDFQLAENQWGLCLLMNFTMHTVKKRLNPKHPGGVWSWDVNELAEDLVLMLLVYWH